MMKETLRRLIADYLAQAPKAPSDEIAAKVSSMMPDDELRDALSAALEAFVAVQRKRIPGTEPLPSRVEVVRPRPEIVAAAPVPPPAVTPVARPAVTMARAPGPSYRQLAGMAWRDRLKEQVVVNGSPKRFEACTLMDVSLLAAGAAATAKLIAFEAAVYQRIADAMRAVDVKTVGELPTTTLQPLLQAKPKEIL